MHAPKIIFMGTADFAVPSLDALLASNYNVVAVVTTPNRPRGRGRKTLASPVSAAAQAHHLPVLQPEDLTDPEFLDALQHYAPDVQVVVAFRILPQAVWNLPPLGTINLHASLLPAYRGAAPIEWAIIHGETQTGVTTFFIDRRVDTGHILLQEAVTIGQQETAGELRQRLAQCGASLLVRTVDQVVAGEAVAKPQEATPEALAKKAPKIYRETCQIDWRQPCYKVYDFVRGLSPTPGAWTMLQGHPCKILQADCVLEDTSLKAGAVRSDGKRWLRVGTSQGTLELKVLQPAGRKSMSAAAFLQGLRSTDVEQTQCV